MQTQSFGKKLSELRKAKNMTQLDLANKMGVSDKAVSKWERDLSYPDIGALPKLADLFDFSVDELIQMGKKTETFNIQGNFHAVIMLILNAIGLAMGIGVTVLSILKEINIYSGFAMVGIGLACISLTLLQKQKESKQKEIL